MHAILVPTRCRREIAKTQERRTIDVGETSIEREFGAQWARATQVLRATPTVSGVVSRLRFCSFAILVGTRWHSCRRFATSESQGF
jgi:hypothetical protein